ncbi:MAG: transcriptional regulator PpsR [Alphaproteobacteria bacterium]
MALSEQAYRDLEALKETIGHLDSDVVAQLIAATADVALVLDNDGVIRAAAFSDADMVPQGGSTWVGRTWSETVTIESRPKISALIKGAATKPPFKWRQVNHHSQGGPDIPVRYFALNVDADGRIVAIGRDLRSVAVLQQRLLDSQQSMEREYARLRQAETRYRLLFQVASEPVMIVNAVNHKVVEVNPAAVSLLSRPEAQILGRSFPDMFQPESREVIRVLMVGGRAEDLRVQLAEGKGECLLSASVFRQDRSTFLLARVSPVEGSSAVRLPEGRSQCLKVIDHLPEGFVVADRDLRIITANPAFLEMTHLASEEHARGEPLHRFIGRSEVDLNVLVSNLRQHGAVRQFNTVLRSAFGSTDDAEVSAVSVPEGEVPCFGFTIRFVTGHAAPPIGTEPHLPSSVEHLTKLVGRVSLKEIVRDTTDLIERLCIEAALELTRDNRASAAEMLGLSRQSLYAKLRRHGIVD